ncbi:hypothetical protein FoTM2_002255 [Fusarium oxysporum f. sp. vasinfectum]|uniref:Uncharacterized protein n=1 Tax=Fusarium oxysporum f. sp. vasinfectum 25433 TaxID=1089449 RepID=X0LIR3_FUSOX|nr:hypothetical protein FOTG_07523 [Fusarium oxysporum f. sp. vasinfectum 25433]KAK2939037.1 hypothetical protein FoTM2_002255 [Fusarium oxysporum f. sp. vasinfectum]
MSPPCPFGPRPSLSDSRGEVYSFPTLALKSRRELTTQPSYRQLSYHADGTWEEGAAALSLLLANLPDLRNYEGEMLEMRDSLEENMFELRRLMEHKDGGLPRELVEKKMMYYLEFIFRLAGEGDEQSTILEQELAKMELALSWVSGLIRHWDEHVSTVLFADAMEQNPHHHQRHQGAN